jgi:hypothetical protein
MDDGPPGLRHYHAAYYGAFLRDPDGNKAACRRAEQQHKRSIARHSLRPLIGRMVLQSSGETRREIVKLCCRLFEN